MNLFLVLPLLIPLLTAVVGLIAWRWRRVQRAAGVAGAALHLGAALGLLVSVWRDGIQAAQMGDWMAPFGITLVADLFSAVMVVITGVMGLGVAVYSVYSIDARREAYGYYPLYNILLTGVSGAFLTGDVFNLYVWFEVMLIASFVLLALGGERAQMEGAIKYVTMNLISSALFLSSVGILYGAFGTLNMADLATRMNASEHPGVVTTLGVLFLVAFGIKAAIFPLFFWLPASYHTPPVAVSAIFAALLTKVGVYALVRVFTLLFRADADYTHAILLVLAGFTMVTGVLGAVAQSEFRRLLSFHIVSQIGYLLMGLALGTLLSLAATVFFMVHVILAKSALFMVSGAVHRIRGTYELKKLGGLFRTNPMLAALFLVPALALAGVPPFSGFFAKLALVKAGLSVEQWTIVGVALVVSILTFFSMMKIWAEVFWKPQPADPPVGVEARRGREMPGLVLPTAAVAALLVAIGLYGEPLMELALRAAEQLLHPEEYIRVVLGAQE